jgi:hypothetical protein
MDLYDLGMEPPAITRRILEGYGSQPIPHHTLFAVAKAERCLGAVSEEVFARVREIIDRGENLAYYRTLGFSEEDIRERGEMLLKLQAEWKTAPKTPRRRRISPQNQFKRLPKGTVAYYGAEGGYYGFVVLDAVYEGRLLAVTEAWTEPPQSLEAVLDAPAHTAVWLLLRSVPKGNHDLGTVRSEGDYNGRAGVFLCKPVSFGINISFSLDECHRRGLLTFSKTKIRDLLDETRVPIRFFNEETAEAETRMVEELMENPASPFATAMIRKAVYLEGFFH